MTTEYSTLPQETSRRWVLRAIGWGLVLGTLLVLLSLRLKERAHPWELVFERNSGLFAGDVEFFDGGLEGGPADLSADGRYLAVGRVGGDCEIWDLDAGPRLVRSLGLTLPDAPREYSDRYDGRKIPRVDDVISMQWLADGNHLAICRRFDWEIFNLAGEPTVSSKLLKYGSYCATSPKTTEIAFAYTGRIFVADPIGRRLSFDEKIEYANTTNLRIAYSSDGRYLLLSDMLGLRVWDRTVRSGHLYHHRELDFSLSPPMIADSNSGIEAFFNRKEALRRNLGTTQPATKPASDDNWLVDSSGIQPGDFATLADSQFSPDGSFIATIYEPYDGSIFSQGPGNPKGRRLRFYETSTGRLLWDTQLAFNPRRLCFSLNGSKLFIFGRPRDSVMPQKLLAFDVSTKSILSEIRVPTQHYSPERMTALPGDRIAIGNYTNWIASSTNRFVPFRVGDSDVAHHIKVSPDGSRILVVGADMTARIYRERRQNPVWGMLGIPETWGVFVLTALLFLGIIWFARPVDAAGVSLLPRSLWFAAILGTMGYALDVSSEIIDWCASGIYAEPEKFKWFHVFGYLIHLLAFIAILGMLRLRRRWWILRIVVVMLGTAVIAFAIALIAYRVTRPGGVSVSVDLFPGVRLGNSPIWYLAMLLPAIAWYGLELRMLLDRSSRNVMRRAYTGGARGFEVNIADKTKRAI